MTLTIDGLVPADVDVCVPVTVGPPEPAVVVVAAADDDVGPVPDEEEYEIVPVLEVLGVVEVTV